MSPFDIIIVVILAWAAISALRNVVRALLVILGCGLLLSLGCALCVRYMPQYVEGAGRLFSLCAKVGGYILSFFMN